MSLLGITSASRGHGDGAAILLGTALACSVGNLAFACLEHHVRARTSLQAATRIGVQLLGDAAVLTFLVHRTGGLASPFLPLFLVPVVAAMCLLPPRWALSATLVSLALPWLAASFGPTQAGAVGHALPLASALPWLVLVLCAGYCASLGRGVIRRLRFQELRLQEARDELEGRVRELHRVQAQEHELRGRLDELSRYSLVAEMATRIAHRIREPLGIVRARAESLRLSERAAREDSMRRDLAVLARNLDVVQRALRGVLAYLPAARLQAVVNLKPILDAELARIGIPGRRFRLVGVRPLPAVIGSHDELELAVGLLLRVTDENAAESVRVRVRARATGRGLEFALRFPLGPDAVLGVEPEASPDPQDTSTFLRLAIVRQVLDKHHADWRLEVRHGRVRMDLCLPLARQATRDPAAVGPGAYEGPVRR